jgi:hypothetical protein
MKRSPHIPALARLAFRSTLGSAFPCAGLVAAALLLAPGAHAQEDDPNAPPKFHDGLTDISPQYAAFEIRFGSYNPKVDQSAFGDVYSDFFGGKNRYIFGIEGDWQFWRAPHLGTLGIGVGWGYTQMSATNQVPDGAPPVSQVSQQSTLNIMPFYAVGVLRVDTFARDFHIPIVPYGKLGFGYAFWWVNDGIGTATTDDGTRGRDTSKGIQAAVGGMFLLDILEPSTARAADSDGGVNNSYLFFEWSMSDYGGAQMNVGSNNWVTGLAFEM